jgi:hypothetical protein
MNFFLLLGMLHSFVRWIIVLVALVAAIKFALGWRNKARVQKSDRALMSAFSGLVDLQVLLGLILLLGQGMMTPVGFPINRIEHFCFMIVAAIVAHTPMRWRKSDDSTALRNNLLVIVVVLVLIVLGVASLGGNRWF